MGKCKLSTLFANPLPSVTNQLERTLMLKLYESYLVEISEMLWQDDKLRLIDVRNLILDFLTSNEVQELDELIIITFRDENNL